MCDQWKKLPKERKKIVTRHLLMGIDEDGELNIYANLTKSSMMEN